MSGEKIVRTVIGQGVGVAVGLLVMSYFNDATGAIIVAVVVARIMQIVGL